MNRTHPTVLLYDSLCDIKKKYRIKFETMYYKLCFINFRNNLPSVAIRNSIQTDKISECLHTYLKNNRIKKNRNRRNNFSELFKYIL